MRRRACLNSEMGEGSSEKLTTLEHTLRRLEWEQR